VFKLTEAPALRTGKYELMELSIELLDNTPRLSIAPLKGELEQVQKCLQQQGLSLPAPTEASLGPCVVLPLGQGQWLFQGVLPNLESLDGLVALTDQSDAWCGFALRGSKAPLMLERLVANAPATYSSGKAVRTQIEHIGCWVVGLAQNEWQVLGPRSSAQSLFDALKHAADAVDALTDN
jgi:sarcosine oxidase subunit gamma